MKWALVCNQQNYCITKVLDIHWMFWNVAYILPAFRCQYSRAFCSYLRLVFFAYYLSFMWPTVLPFHEWDFFFSLIFFSLLFLSLVWVISLTQEFVLCCLKWYRSLNVIGLGYKCMLWLTVFYCFDSKSVVFLFLSSLPLSLSLYPLPWLTKENRK